ncbi:hypothetical protein [Kocuria rosea]|uniref:Uncharacterized protein n=1 Tax=Kocuria rosea subsp. polaris TaxID=136273 RepID=A0A0A6VPW0_KOCRO|nr:hypothetical protein [Kocuria polaris]KHD96676.1 hypothetical protein GY22_14600 [Kocuria polaris]
MSDHTIARTFVFFGVTLAVYVLITTVTKLLPLRTLSSFMFSTDSDMLWQILAVGAGIAIALQVNVHGNQANTKNELTDDLQDRTHSASHPLTKYTPTLIAAGVTFPTFDYLFSFVMRPERQLVQWPAWEISSALCFTLAISALCMNAQSGFLQNSEYSKGPSGSVSYRQSDP